MFNIYVSVNGDVYTDNKDIHIDNVVLYIDGSFKNINKEDLIDVIDTPVTTELEQLNVRIDGYTALLTLKEDKEAFDIKIADVPTNNEIVTPEEMSKIITVKPEISVNTTTPNENSEYLINITNYDKDNVYYIKTDIGSYTINRDVVTVDVKSVNTDTVGYLEIRARGSNMLLSAVERIDVTVLHLDVIDDAAIVDNAYDINKFVNNNFEYKTNSMDSTKDNSYYIEKVVDQEPEDTDWVEVSSTTVKYIPETLDIESTNRTTVVSRFNKFDVNDNMLITDINDAIARVKVTDKVSVEPELINVLTASDAEASDYFGISAAISGNGLVAIIGAIDEDTAASNAGKVYTYKRDTIDDDWTEVNQLTASDAEASDNFGVSIAISADGLIAMIGAHSEDTVANNAGKAYTYKRTTIDDDWTEVNQLTASDAEASDRFGRTIAISSDGLVAMVGSELEDTAAADAGKVYTYKRATIDDDWTEVNQLTASDAKINGHYGLSVSISSDGLISMVGAYNTDSSTGKVYTYKRDTIDDDWIEVNQLTASDATAGDLYSLFVNISSNGLLAMVGSRASNTEYAKSSGKVYTYKRATIDDDWIEVSNIINIESKNNDYFGSSMAMSADASVCIIGAFSEDTAATNAGKVYTYKNPIPLYTYTIDSELVPSKVFKNDNVDVNIYLDNDINPYSVFPNEYLTVLDSSDVNTLKIAKTPVSALPWKYNEVNTLTASDAEAGDFFGMSVAISSDGLIAMVGAHGEDTAATDAGKVYTYKRDTINDGWTEVNTLTASDAEAGDLFGVSVAISGDGLVCTVGAYREDTAATDAGKVYTYKRATIDDDWTEVSKLTASDAEEGDRFGRSISLSNDGLILIAGTLNNKVYTYKRATIDDAWSEASKLTASDYQTGDQFGGAVSVSKDGLILVASTWNKYNNVTYAGKVYTYKRATIDDDWIDVNQLTASDVKEGDVFGDSIALSDDGLILIASSTGSDANAKNSGKIYQYRRDTVDDDWVLVNTLLNSEGTIDIKFGRSIGITSDASVMITSASDYSGDIYKAGKAYTYKSNIDTYIKIESNQKVILNNNVNNIGDVTEDNNTYTVDVSALNLTKIPDTVYIKPTISLDKISSTTTEYVGNGDVNNIIKPKQKIEVDNNVVTVTDVNKELVSKNIWEYKETNTLTASDAEVSDLFGRAVAISSDGLIAMVGAYAVDTTATDTGKVYTYKRATIDDNWTEVNQLTASDAEASDQFGISVAISSDGLIAIIGAYKEDTAATDAGKVYTYKRATIDDAWIEVNTLTASDAEEGDRFGTSVTLSSDGLIAIVGAYGEDTAADNAGKVYTYKRDTIDDDWTEVNTLTASDAEKGDIFGMSVAISSDGLIAMVGAYAEDTAATNAGKVYTYKRATIDDNWVEVNQLTASDAEDDDYFGISVAISSDGLIAMVGAHAKDTTASNAGKVYTYKRDTIDDDWTEVNQLTASGVKANNYFGISVSISSDGLIIMVGAHGDDTAAGNAGKVYTYTANVTDGVWKYTLTVPEQSSNINTVKVIDNSQPLSINTMSYNGSYFINLYNSLTATGRNIIRKISTRYKGIKILHPFTSQLKKLND